MINRDVIDRMNNDQFSEFIITLIFMSAGIDNPKEETQELFQKSKDNLMKWLEADDTAILKICREIGEYNGAEFEHYAPGELE